MVLLSGVNESIVSMILSHFDLNPLLLWEIILRQQYDKVLKIDESTILYNIEVLDLNSIDKQVLVKVIHLLNKNLMIVIIDNSGVKMMMHLMKKLFKFKEIK